MKKYNINCKNTYLINEYEEIHMIDDIFYDVFDQLIDQGLDPKTIMDWIDITKTTFFTE